MNLTKNEETTINRLFKRGVDALGMPEEINADSIGKIIKAGLDAEQKFIQEMLDNRTDRSKKARKILCAQIYVGALDRGLAGNLLREFQDEAQRKDFYAARDFIEA